MARPKSSKPKLYKRGKDGKYFFRRFVNGKDKEINTGANELKAAEAFRKRYIDSETVASVKIRQGETAMRAASTVIKTITGKKLERISFAEGYQIYVEHTPDYGDLSASYRSFCESVYRNFSAWCTEQNLQYMDEVTQSIAVRYAKMIWERGVAEATHDSHAKTLSKIFTTVDVMKSLPNRNPFHDKIVRRRRKGMISEATHQPFEPYMLKAIMEEAAAAGEDWLDLFLVGLHTGMRAKDAALFQWSWIHGKFIEFMPYKTRKYRIVARVPISKELQAMLDRRKAQGISSPYVNPAIAAYRQTSDWITNRSQAIIDRALGPETTKILVNERRKRKSCIYSFHSFRTTLMSLLAMNQTPYRDAMEIFGWRSMEMVQVYEKMLERGRGERDQRNLEVIERLDELRYPLLNLCAAQPKLRPTAKQLENLISQYSNRTIARIYDISDVAISKWLKRFDLKRTKRLLTPDLTENEILKIREELQAA